MRICHLVTVTAMLALVGLYTVYESQRTNAPVAPQIIFVCEHGAGKSVIAAAYFNKLAAERGLPIRAIYRGANPSAELSAAALEGLRKDGVALPTTSPSAITTDDVNAATHILQSDAPCRSTPRRVAKPRTGPMCPNWATATRQPETPSSDTSNICSTSFRTIDPSSPRSVCMTRLGSRLLLAVVLFGASLGAPHASRFPSSSRSRRITRPASTIWARPSAGR